MRNEFTVEMVSLFHKFVKTDIKIILQTIREDIKPELKIIFETCVRKQFETIKLIKIKSL